MNQLTAAQIAHAERDRAAREAEIARQRAACPQTPPDSKRGWGSPLSRILPFTMAEQRVAQAMLPAAEEIESILAAVPEPTGPIPAGGLGFLRRYGARRVTPDTLAKLAAVMPSHRPAQNCPRCHNYGMIQTPDGKEYCPNDCAASRRMRGEG